MPLVTVLKNEHFEWMDLVNPSPKDLLDLAEKYRLDPNAVKDCLDPEHHPKFERFGDINFAIFRSYDEECSPKGDSVQELTRKIALFYNSKLLITIHRKKQNFLDRFILQKQNSNISTEKLSSIIVDLIGEIIDSYNHPVDAAIDQLELLEMSLFEVPGTKPFKIKQAYYLKRRASVFKRVTRLTQEVLTKLLNDLSVPASSLQDLKERADSLFFYSDELLENTNSLLNMHISLASQKTNEASHRTGEVVRVLTIFSVFLLPLNLITGIYGMNFVHMPELQMKSGYPMALVMMLLICILIFVWFKTKGWLK